MKIFISWSKQKSMECAKETKNLIERIDKKIKVFISEVDIIGGEDVQEKIYKNILNCDKLVLCYTNENKKSPWLLFEAGYARGLGKTVIPLLFDNDPNWPSWTDNPMNVAREINFNDTNFEDNFIRCFNLKSSVKNRREITEYSKTIRNINEKFRIVDINCEDLVNKLLQKKAFTVENPKFKGKAAYFISGFESYDLLSVIIETFLYTGKYLWIYGRKNMKLFGGSYKDFFQYLNEKSLIPGMDGIDFRCLFLDPKSKEVENAHTQKKIFKSELEATLLRASDVIGENTLLKKCFRLYSDKREEIIIRIDNSIIYSFPTFDSMGRPHLLTNTAFEVFSVESDKGKRCVEKFNLIWSQAREME